MQLLQVSAHQFVQMGVMDVQIFFLKKACPTAVAATDYNRMLRIIAQRRKHCESFADLQSTATGTIKQAY